MKDIIQEQLQRFRHIHQSTRRYAAVLLVLSLLTVLAVNWKLHDAGIPRDAIPQRAGLFALRTDLETINPDYLVDGCEDVIPGDVVTYYNRDGDETSGLSCCGRLADGCGGTPAGIQAQKAAVNHSYAQKGSCTESCAGPFFVANHQKTSAVKFPNAGNKLRMLL